MTEDRKAGYKKEWLETEYAEVEVLAAIMKPYGSGVLLGIVRELGPATRPKSG
jgi:hypothetical protein